MVLKFRGQWRSYQKRILDELEFHLRDEKLHIVAAPGAGKTTLGIEVLSRLKQPSLILCPTNTIKNQWKERICSSFLEPDECDLVSTNILEPKFITVITYQALLASFCGKVDDTKDRSEEEEEIEEENIKSSSRFNPNKSELIIKTLKDANISVLCFDEAHHLRKEWWKALNYLVEELEPKQTVALTATPPYDVNYGEWERYETLCGEIDEAISIPELVQNGDLCPHQDFIHFSLLKDSENLIVKKQTQCIADLLYKLKNDRQLLLYLRGMKFFTNPKDELEKIFDNPEFYVSIVSFLKSTGVVIPKEFLKLFDAKEYELPRFNLTQAKIFLNGFLITNCDEFSGFEDKITEYLNFAKSRGLIQNKRIVLDDSAKIQKRIAGSVGKLDSIVQIVELENSNLGKDLRMVILADYIKANDTCNDHIGVVPIWRTLKNKYKDISLGILCGSLIIVRASLEKAFLDLLEENSLDKNCVTISPYKEDANFITITPKESAKHCIVSIITEMFNKGYFTVLIGTQALLGEGWDAPCINSLILSSTVSSYMLSNQMKGRAIRIDKNNPNKISNIWHLASVKIPSHSDLSYLQAVMTSDDAEAFQAGLYDIESLTKRFEGFEAPSYFGKHEISNGIERVLPETIIDRAKIEGEKVFINLNRQTMERAKNRQQTKQFWDEALYLGYGQGYNRLRVGVDAPMLTAKSLTYDGYNEMFEAILYEFLAIIVCIPIRHTIGLYLMAITFVIFLIVLVNLGLKYLRTGTVEGIMKQIAIVHIEALDALGFLKTSLKKVGFKTFTSVSVYLSCDNLSTEENNLLINSMREFLDPIDNPRYLLVRREKFMNIIRQTDYFAIPSVLSTKKRDVDLFAQLWRRYIGPCEVVYTRNVEGRKLLLKARKIAFSACKRAKTKKLSKWQ